MKVYLTNKSSYFMRRDGIRWSCERPKTLRHPPVW